jgi:ribosomal protein S18 acetylase RimI-like enzyme
MSTTITITDFTDAAVDVVWQFFQLLPEGDRTFVKEPVTDRETVAGWSDGVRARRCIARVDGTVVGYLAVLPGVGWSRHVGELRLVVDPQMRRQGIGQRLASHGLRVALEAGLTKLVVEVVAHQDSTIALFTRLGFRAEALLEDHVQDPSGTFSDLIVLAIRTDDDWRLLNTVGLDHTLD